MDDETPVAEPVVDRWADRNSFSQRKGSDARMDLSIFSLSGGVMKNPDAAGDGIDGLLDHIVSLPSSGAYHTNVDRNLDYLFTSLQLDVINSIAERCSGLQEATRGSRREDSEKDKVGRGVPPARF